MDIGVSTPVSTSTPVLRGNTAGVDKKFEAASEPVLVEFTQQKTKCQEMSKTDIDKTTEDMNKLMQLLNADLQFDIHEETQRIIVKLVDVKHQKVLKEFPPHELLDTLAAIRDYIGLLLDKKV